MHRTTKRWICLFLSMLCILILGIGGLVVYVDPYFHYHKPITNRFYYFLNNERSQNDGILRNYEYDAIITGTSMTENFKSSEVDSLWGVKSVKVPYSGATYKEIDEAIKKAYQSGNEIKLVIRGIDTAMFLWPSDCMRDELGEYPIYLYDNNVFNDVKYVLNMEIMVDAIFPMLRDRKKDDFTPGVTSFDDYANWQKHAEFGFDEVFPDGVDHEKHQDETPLTDEDIAIIEETVEKNIVSTIRQHPETTYYLFFPPYSISWWNSQVNYGVLNRYFDSEKIVIERLLECDNVRLFSFSECHDIITNLDNYRDELHYGEDINSKMLNWMKEGKYLITKSNYDAYLNAEIRYYSSFDYMKIGE